ncbi:MAG TPA: NAD(+)/NADH kinase [Actinomycetota bacterium]|nr:NAD(+)/NADH kinase [Actinomycetota bacterium]
MTVKRVSIVAHEAKPEAARLLDAVTTWMGERSIEVAEDGALDLVISLGGDGTTLRAAQVAHAADAPLLSVNLGTLGYLSEVDASDAFDALSRVVEADFEVEDRMMLSCDIDSPGRSYVGLNEVLVERTSRRRLVRLSVRIGGESLTDFNADGVIVATPTGSTAYALSAGGPIVSPRAQCIVVVPVSAHIIFARPFVIPADETVEITVRGQDQEASVSLDGAIGCDVASGTTVVVRQHPRPLRLVRFKGPRFIERLRIKLGLPG